MSKPAAKPRRAKKPWRERLTLAAVMALTVSFAVLISGAAAGYYAFSVLYQNKLRDTWALLFLDLERRALSVPARLAAESATAGQLVGTFEWQGDALKRVTGRVPQELRLFELGLKALPPLNQWTMVRYGGSPHVLRVEGRGTKRTARLWTTDAANWLPLAKAKPGDTSVYVASREGVLMYSNLPGINQSTFTLRPLVKAFIKSNLKNSQLETKDDAGVDVYGFYLEIPGTNLVLFGEAMKAKVLTNIKDIGITYGMLLLLLLVGTVALVQWPLRRAVGPIRELSLLSKEVSAGNFNVEARQEGLGELVPLVQSFRFMTSSLIARDKALMKLMADREQKIRLDGELAIAKSIQDRFLFRAPIPESSGVRLSARYLAADQVAGDWYGYVVEPATGDLIAVIADVSGHGVGSAMFTAIIAAVFDEFRERKDFTALFEPFLLATHDRIKNIGQGAFHASVLICRISTSAKEIELWNAGHVFPILSTDDGAKVVAKPVKLKSTPLGLTSTPTFASTKIPITAKSKILLYTDGLTEARSKGGVQYGAKRLVRTLEKQGRMTPDGGLEALIADWRRHRGESSQEDDVCAINLHVA